MVAGERAVVRGHQMHTGEGGGLIQIDGNTRANTRIYKPKQAHTRTYIFCLSLSHTHTNTHTLSLTHTFTHNHTRTHAHTNTHTHTHTHMHTRTQTLPRIHRKQFFFLLGTSVTHRLLALVFSRIPPAVLCFVYSKDFTVDRCQGLLLPENLPSAVPHQTRGTVT